MGQNRILLVTRTKRAEPNSTDKQRPNTYTNEVPSYKQLIIGEGNQFIYMVPNIL